MAIRPRRDQPSPSACVLHCAKAVGHLLRVTGKFLLWPHCCSIDCCSSERGPAAHDLTEASTTAFVRASIKNAAETGYLIVNPALTVSRSFEDQHSAMA
jgi:hypothetical protein